MDYIDIEISCEEVKMIPGSGDFTVIAKNVLPEQVMKSLRLEQVLEYFGVERVIEAIHVQAE